MYLKEIRINGFKSFADRTRLDLSPGITAIVGPNGCGKSNIADAIRWVLGEQSAKSLRAGSMQDVIFQGTEGRKQLGLCEVALVFTDCEEQLGTAYAEVEITRRVTRDGGSDYLLNGKKSRLKDIHNLFMDTGVGRVSYSFMVQGQIDQILSSNPAERRTIFEEAAGISKYKAQRREAMLKLEHVEANLARVTDVIEEVGRQIGSLKRQASKALRYKRIRHRLTHLDLAHRGHRYGELLGAIQTLEKDDATLRKEVATLTDALAGREASLTEKRTARGELYDRMQDAQQNVFNLRSEKENAENQAEFAATRAQDLAERIESLKQELQDIASRKGELTTQAAGDTQAKQQHLNLFGDSDKTFKGHSEELTVAQQALTDAESVLQRAKQDVLMLESGITRARSNCTTLEVDLKTYQVKHSSLAEEKHTLEEEHGIIGQDIKEIAETLAKREKDKSGEDDAFQQLRDALAETQTQFRNLQIKIQEADRNAAQHIAQIGVLESLQQKFEGFGEGAKAILKGKLEEVMPAQSARLLTRELAIDSEYTGAFEALMGPAVDAILVADGSSASRITDALAAKSLGRACLHLEGAGNSPKPGVNGVPEWLTPAAHKVRAKSETDSEVFSGLLSDCYFCEDLDNFLEYWKGNPGFDFQLVATTQGELVDCRGFIYGGHGKGESDTFLQRENQIKRLKVSQGKVEKELTDLRAQADGLQEKLDHGEEAIELKRQRLSEISEEISTLREQQRSGQDKLQQNRQRAEQAARNLAELEQSRTISEERLEKARGELGETEKAFAANKTAISDAEAAVEKQREQRDAKRENLNEVRLDLAEKRQRLDMIDRALGELEKQTGELNRQQTRREQEIDTITGQIAELQGEAEQAQERSAEIEKTLSVCMESLNKNRDELKAAESAIKEIEGGLSSERTELHDKETALNKREVQLARERAQLDYVAEETRREYETEISQIQWKRELWQAGEELPERIRVDIEDEDPADDAPLAPEGDPTDEDLRNMEDTDWREIESEVETLRSRLNAMGPVNIDAIQEYSELKERHDFLREQSEDLWKSKDQLVAAIDDINQTSQQLFQETFEQVRKNFKYTFETLFGGGLSDLALVDNEDVLESGIDITARPPGTKLKTLALLSGGQKTMTAVALLFAIYMVKPSPFCMLDELDAPLDDANVGRFTGIVQKFTRHSQFIIITHNKRTIAAADTIYGVTMQEKGVSNLVSMRFDQKSVRTETPPDTPETVEPAEANI